MPIVSTIEGNLLAEFKQKKYFGIAHGCNCQQVMGAGIAEQIAREFPSAYDADLSFTGNRFGSFSYVNTDYGNIYNMYTQIYTGKGISGTIDSNSARYAALESAFELLSVNMYDVDIHPNKIIGIPLIGCGLAGLDWNIVKELINDITLYVNIEVVIYKP